MLRPRLIPVLLIHNGGLVKTIKFSQPKYVGDPINAVRIFNEKQADELMVVDIDASVNGREPDYKTISHLAMECRMPLCYGGGVRSAENFERLVELGVEKVAICSAAVEDAEIISEAAQRVGSQSVVVVMDVKRTGFTRSYEIVTHNATRRTGLNPCDFAKSVSELGAGEIVVNSVDADGTMIGYDMKLVESVRDVTSVPLTICGGAGSMKDVGELWKTMGPLGAAAGSMFVFKGKYRAVLISYPRPDERSEYLPT